MHQFTVYDIYIMELHERIKTIRESRGISQSQAADAIGISYQSYWKIENGKTAITISRLNQIADILKSSLPELLGFNTDEGITQTQKGIKHLEAEVKELNEDVKGLLLTGKDFVRREYFWLNGGVLVIAKMIKKGIELGLLDEKNYQAEIKGQYITNLFMRRSTEVELQNVNFQSDLTTIFPESKVMPILNELFKLDWFRLIVQFLPYEDRLRELLGIWVTDNSEYSPSSINRTESNL